MGEDATPKDPGTDAEWQAAVDVARGLLAIESARLYGLITGGPRCNVERCQEILSAGAQRGLTPTKDAVENTMKVFLYGKSTGD